ncbi:MAG: sugar kinase [Gammaproteobacteria bacterium]|nr:sugar kinase [Gammaproteobacteria bacterium]
MADVFVAGVAVVDFVFNVDEMPTRFEKYRATDAVIVGGGCAANAAVAITRLGGHASLAARLGDDDMAEIILADLQREHVNTDLVVRAKNGRSSFSSVYVDPRGERQIMNFRGAGLEESTQWLDAIPHTDAVLTDNRWPPGTAKTAEIARRRDVPGIVDAEDPIDIESLTNASHIAFSKQGLVALTGESDSARALKSLTTRLTSWLCVTDGPNGVYFLANGQVEHIPGFTVEVKDTLGAGDIWHGAFALRLAEGASEDQAIQFANAAASLKCTRFGGRSGCPDRTTTDNFLKERV